MCLACGRPAVFGDGLAGSAAVRVRCEDGCHASGAPGEYWITTRLAGIFLSLGSLHSRERFRGMLRLSKKGTQDGPVDITDLEPEGGR